MSQRLRLFYYRRPGDNICCCMWDVYSYVDVWSVVFDWGSLSKNELVSVDMVLDGNQFLEEKGC